MLRVTIFVFDDEEDDFEPRGSFVLEPGGRVAIDVPPEGMEWMQTILAEEIKSVDEDGNVGAPCSAQSDPEGWMRGLPVAYDGMRVRAELEEEE